MTWLLVTTICMALPAPAEKDAVDSKKAESLFNGKDLTHWEFVPYHHSKNPNPQAWKVHNGAIVCTEHGGWLRSAKEYGDFEFSMEYKLEENANSGIFIRSPENGKTSKDRMEIQIIDDRGPAYTDPKNPKYYRLKPYQHTGSVYGVQPPSHVAGKPAGNWNHLVIRCKGRQVTVMVNGVQVNHVDLKQRDREFADKVPGMKRTKGYIGISSHNGLLAFRNITIKKLD